MTARRAALTAGLTVAAVVIGWVLFVGLPRWTAPRPADPAIAVPPSEDAKASPKIQARLFYLAPSGTALRVVETEVEFGATPAEQARHIVSAQLEPAPEPFVSAIPPGTKLRNLYLTPDGVAYVDLSAEVSRAHPGGSLAEILTVYSVVNALADNMPAVSGVQLLVEGREVDTLAGHVDLRRPLEKNERWTEMPADKPPAEAAKTSGPGTP